MISAQWLAGFFDGEGCLSLVSSKARPKRFSLQVTLVNTHKPTLLAIQEVFGGQLYSTNVNKEGWRTRHTLMWNGLTAKAFLEKIFPYSITKKDQIELVLSVWYPLYEKAGPGKRVTEEDLATRMSVVQKLSALKRIEYPIQQIVN